MNESLKQFLTKRNIIATIFLVIILLAIPISVYLVQQQQKLKSKATGDPITFAGSGVSCATNPCTTSASTIDISFHSPYGSYIGPTATPTPTPTPGPTSTPTSTPTPPWSSNLLNPNMQSRDLKSTYQQATQWSGPAVSTATTYTLSGTVNFLPSIPGADYPVVAEIQADEYDSTGTIYSTYHNAISTRDKLNGGTFSGSTTFTLQPGKKAIVILRSINSKADFSNVSLKTAAGTEILSPDMQTKHLESTYQQATQWVGPVSTATTYMLSGTVEFTPSIPGADYPVVAEIQADEYDSTGTIYSTYHNAISTRDKLNGGTFSGSTTFTLQPGKKAIVILRSINSDAHFTDVKLVSR